MDYLSIYLKYFRNVEKMAKASVTSCSRIICGPDNLLFSHNASLANIICFQTKSKDHCDFHE